jgi:peptidoglycan/xylan/chitin deacetylase (PgdA/CDA1 family)
MKAAALVGSGVASLTRVRRASETTFLSFHGLCESAGDPEVLDWSLHLPVDLFRAICARLAEDYHVIALSEFVEARQTQTRLPDNSVVISFDDGYASNHDLAYPLLKEYGLWFQRADLALSRTRKPWLDWRIDDRKQRLPLGSRKERQRSLSRLLAALKELTDMDLLGEMDRLEHELEVSSPTIDTLPKPMRPMTWDMVCDLSLGGLVEIGGHTHTHPVLSRCDPLAMRAEIFTCRDRILTEMGDLPIAFAYPNGKAGDYTRETVRLVQEAGFKAACTTVPGRADAHTPMLQIPRYGSPESVWEAEATVSGAFETLKEWRQGCLHAMAMT